MLVCLFPFCLVCVCVCEGASEGSMGSIFERGAEWANDMGAAC